MPNKKLHDALLAIATLTDKEQYAVFIALREVFDPHFMLKPWESVSQNAEATHAELRRRVEKTLELMNFDPTSSHRGGANFRQWLEIYSLTEDAHVKPSPRPQARRKQTK
jgi:hypothetical protein